jgi:hypothetical protein
MSREETVLLEKRKAEFAQRYQELIPALVDFVEKLGIQPGHEVLKHAVEFAPPLERALRDMKVADDPDRVWLLARMGYFIGEYFAQKYAGAWYVNEIPGSRYYARYVVGRFAALNDPKPMIDPFEIARVYVDTPPPRTLTPLLAEVDAELKGAAR